MTNVTTKPIEKLSLSCVDHLFVVHPQATAWDAEQVIDQLLEQARATAAALLKTGESTEHGFTINHSDISSCLWSIQTQIELAQKARAHTPTQETAK